VKHPIKCQNAVFSVLLQVLLPDQITLFWAISRDLTWIHSTQLMRCNVFEAAGAAGRVPPPSQNEYSTEMAPKGGTERVSVCAGARSLAANGTGGRSSCVACSPVDVHDGGRRRGAERRADLVVVKWPACVGSADQNARVDRMEVRTGSTASTVKIRVSNNPCSRIDSSCREDGQVAYWT
jgi:hypothetical protein